MWFANNKATTCIEELVSVVESECEILNRIGEAFMDEALLGW